MIPLLVPPPGIKKPPALGGLLSTASGGFCLFRRLRRDLASLVPRAPYQELNKYEYEPKSTGDLVRNPCQEPCHGGCCSLTIHLEVIVNIITK